MSGWTGLDLSKYGRGEPILRSRQDAQTSALDAFTIADPDRVRTVREIAKHAAVGGRGPVVVGSPTAQLSIVRVVLTHQDIILLMI